MREVVIGSASDPMRDADRLKIISGTANLKLAQDICSFLGHPLGQVEIRRFPDLEVDIKVGEDVRGCDVFVVQPTCPPANEQLMELLLMIDCLRRASAQRITAVLPYYGYARKDRKDEGRVPISAKLVANLITTAGANRVLTVDLHAAQIQGFFDIPVDHLYARPVFLDRLRRVGDLKKMIVVSPDVGGVKMARAYAKALGDAPLAIVDKRRISGEQTVVEAVIGDVAGRDVVLIDDMISTAGSITEAVRIVRRHGAERVIVAATHGVFCGPAVERLRGCEAEAIFVTDTIPQRPDLIPRLEVVSVAKLLARAIWNIHHAKSVSSLFEDDPH